jgi:hypothetical protein
MNVRLLLRRIIHGSFGNLTSNERVILDALTAALPPDSARILAKQIAQIEIIQRSARGRMVLPFYNLTAPPEKLAVPAGEFCLARVQFTDDTHKGSVRVQTYDGHFRSLEFSRSPKDFPMLHVIAVDLHPQDQRSLADALNRAEHGTNDS